MKGEPLPQNPLVSVIIVTLDRSASLREALDYFLHSEKYDPLELVVVDQSHTEENARNELMVKGVPRLRYVHVDYKSICRARNEGLKLAGGEILIFVDDDARPHDGFVAAHVRAYSDPSVWAATGSVVNSWQQKLKSREEVGERAHRRMTDRSLTGVTRFDVDFEFFADWATGTNMSFRKNAFKEIGGFDENLSDREDAEFCHRLKKAGGLIRYVPDACVKHLELLTGGNRLYLGSGEYVKILACSNNYFWYKVGCGLTERCRRVIVDFIFANASRRKIFKGNILSFVYFFLLGIMDAESRIKRLKNSNLALTLF